MKKTTAFLLPILLISSSLVSCDKNKPTIDERIHLSYGNINTTEGTLIDEETINQKILHKESFLFVVYDGTCGCWRDFRDGVLNPYIKENKLICYLMNINDYRDTLLSKNTGLSAITGATVFGVFENGQLKTTLNTTNNNELKDKTLFSKFMKATVRFPNIYYISEDDVERITSSDKSAVIYFGRSGCDDCSYINRTTLKRYFDENNNTNNLYYFDMETMFKTLSTDNYQIKKNEFGLSKEINTEFGYIDGKVPFFSYIDHSNWVSGAVAFNDTVSLVNDKYVVTESYYTAERLSSLQYMDSVDTKVIKGLELNAEEDLIVSTKAYWKHESAEKYYDPIIRSFLNYALPKSTFKF